MADFYQRRTGPDWNKDYVTAQTAEKLIAEAYERGRWDARAAPAEDVYGIRFLTGLQPGVGGIWVWLRPVSRDQIPAADLERLEREASDRGPV